MIIKLRKYISLIYAQVFVYLVVSTMSVTSKFGILRAKVAYAVHESMHLVKLFMLFEMVQLFR